MTGNDETYGVQPAKWAIGPPAPRIFAWLARGCSLAVLVLIGHWIHVTLGGVAVAPEVTPDGNDTGKLFNWHPVLMTLGFVVFMAEALLSYQAPLLPGVPREVRKRIHWGCHSAAVLCLLLGLAAVLQSHRLKLPVPMPDWYSPHSYMGITALSLVALQFLFGCYAYLFPRLSLPSRMALGPLHRFAGATAWLAGLAAVATGLQEKLTFLQMGKKLSGDALYGAAVRVPAAVLPVLVVLAALVLYFQVAQSQAGRQAGVGVPLEGSGGSASQALLRGGVAAVAAEEEDEDALGHRRV